MNRFSFKKLAIGLLAAIAVLGTGPAFAGSTPFSRIVVFGDSLSDTGNLYLLSGGYPPAPYAEGRFSNGPLWIEYLAEKMGMQVSPEDNYAVAGATTGHDNFNDGLFGMVYPGLQDQLDAFLGTLPASGADPHALYVVWIGANDFFVALGTGVEPEELVGTGVENTVHALQALWQAGARHILVVNVPDLGITPFGLGSGIGGSISALSFAYNQALASALQSLADAGIPTIQVDAFSTLGAMVSSAEQFGFTNVTEPFLLTGGDPAGFVYWDIVHPTTRGHEVLAEAARVSLIEYYLEHGSGAVPPALIHSLNGLVTASEVR